MLEPERADCPFPPRPLVLPWPPPSPQPTRFLRWIAPGTFLSSWSFMVYSSEAPRPAHGGTELGWVERDALGLAELREALGQVELEERVDRSVDDRDVVLRTHRLRQDVL